MCGMRQAAQGWEEWYARKMEGAEFRCGIGNSVVFYHRSRDISVLVRGDDFVAVGEDEDLEWFRRLAVGWFEMKVRGKLGGGVNDEKEMVILGMRMRWTTYGWELEADNEILRRLKQQFGFDEWTRASASSGEKKGRQGTEKGEMSGKEEARSF